MDKLLKRNFSASNTNQEIKFIFDEQVLPDEQVKEKIQNIIKNLQEVIDEN